MARNKGFGFEIETWERPAAALRRTRWVNNGLARSDDSVVDGELMTRRGEVRRIWFRSEDGQFVGERRLENAADRRDALELAPETVDVVAELRAAARSGLTADNGRETFGGRHRRRITRERTSSGSIVRDRWFINEDSGQLMGMRRERWEGDVLQDNQTYRLTRYQALPFSQVRNALTFAAGQ